MRSIRSVTKTAARSRNCGHNLVPDSRNCGHSIMNRAAATAATILKASSEAKPFNFIPDAAMLGPPRPLVLSFVRNCGRPLAA